MGRRHKVGPCRGRLGVKCTSLFACAVVFVVRSQGEIEPDALVGAWLFDEEKGNKALDASGNGLHGELVGNPAYVNGRYGKALELSGDGDLVKIRKLGVSFPTEEVTIITWAMITGDDNQDILSMEPVGPERVTVNLPWGNAVSWQFGQPGSAVNLNFNGAWIGQWKHWTFVSSVVEDFLAIYLDGVEVGRIIKLAGTYVPRMADFHIGGRLASSFEGVIDEFAVFNTPLGEDDIMEVMEKGLADAVALPEAVDPVGKLAATWGALKSIEQREP